MPVRPLGRWALGWSIAALSVAACGESRSPGATPSAVPSAPVASITQISIAQASLAGGQSTEGTVTLSGPAPSGVSVTLSSSHPTVTVPRSVSVAASATSATFSITTQPVTAMTDVSITATLGSSTQTTVLRVNLRGPTILSFSVDPSVAGGQTLTAAIEIDAPAPDGGVAVALSSDNGAVRVPATATVPAGATRATVFIPTTGVSTDVRATITATFGGESRAAAILIRAAVLRALTVEPSVTGGSAASGTVRLDGSAPPSGGVVVTLSGSNATAAVPNSVQVASGANGATFSISTSVVTRVSFVQITATFGGVSLAATLEVRPR